MAGITIPSFLTGSSTRRRSNRVRVTPASKISSEECARLNLGYLDPSAIDPAEWQNREDKGIVYLARAGERLYKLRHLRR
jgi:lactate racemase